MLKNIRYDRSQRRYHITAVHSGHLVAVVPAGKKGRRVAFQFGVMAHNSRLHQIACEWVQHHPQLGSRVWRAAEIVLSNGVMPAWTMQYLAEIESQSSEYGNYELRMVDESIVCNCEDFESFAAPMIGDSLQPCCKHVLAFMMSQQLEQVVM